MAEETPLSAAAIYDKITGGQGSDSLKHSAEITTQLHKQLMDRAQEVKALSKEIGEGWQGPAGAAAAGAALPLAKAAEADADNLHVAGSSIEQQTNAFGTVHGSVNNVPAVKPMMTDEQLVTAVFGGDTPAYDREVDQWREASRQNVQAFATYHQASTANGEQLPTMYEPLVDPGYPIAMSSGGTMPSTGGGTGGSASYSPGGTGGTNPAAGPPPSTPTVRPGDSIVPTTLNTTPDTPRPSTPTPSYDGVDTPAASTSTSGRDSGSTSASSFIPPSYGPSGTPGTGGYGTSGDYRTPGMRGTTFTPGGGGSTGGYGGTGMRGGGYGSSYSPGSGYGTGSGGGYRTGGAPSHGAGRTTGAVPQRSSVGTRVGSFATGATTTGGGSATTGRGMMPMSGAGRGQGGDEQHERKVPYTEDPFELFPHTGGVVPPVIGEKPPNQR